MVEQEIKYMLHIGFKLVDSWVHDSSRLLIYTKYHNTIIDRYESDEYQILHYHFDNTFMVNRNPRDEFNPNISHTETIFDWMFDMGGEKYKDYRKYLNSIRSEKINKILNHG